MDKELLEALSHYDTSNIASKLYNRIDFEIINDDEDEDEIHTISMVTAMCMLEKLKKNIYVKDLLGNNIIIDCIDAVRIRQDDLEKFSPNEIMAYVLYGNEKVNYKGEQDVPPHFLINLLIQLLDISDINTVLNLFSRTGDVFVDLIKTCNPKKIVCVEDDRNLWKIACLRNSILENKTQTILGDPFMYSDEQKFDKVIVIPPITGNVSFNKNTLLMILDKFGLDRDDIPKVLGYWIYALKILSCLEKDGKGVMILPTGELYNDNSKYMREHLVKKGYIESVILLAPKLYKNNNKSIAIIVLSYDNTKVKMIDASNICVWNRRRNIISDENREEIIDLEKNSKHNVIEKNLDELREYEYILDYSRYLKPIMINENIAVPLESVLMRLKRGAQVSAMELDELTCKYTTPFQYISIPAINDGYVDGAEIHYLKYIPEKYQRYCLKRTSIVLTKMGTPNFKSAVIECADDVQILVNSNIFILEIDEEKANPYYIQALFFSKYMDDMFNQIYAGTSSKTLSSEKLKKILIPLPDKGTQSAMAYKYKKNIQNIKAMKREINETKRNMKDFSDELFDLV